MGSLDYLNQLSDSTVRAYRNGLKTFFKMVYGEGGDLEKLAERYFGEKRDYEKDVQDFLVALKGYAPYTVRLRLSAIRVFLLENGVEPPQRFWRRLRGRIKGSRALTLDKVPSNKELRMIVTHMPVQGKALYLTLASSGMRIGEALRLTVKDVELNLDPAKLSIRGEYTKTGNPRIAFVSSEARDAMQEWLKVRTDYLNAAAGKSHLYPKSEEDSRLFPFSSTNARMIWKNALGKAKMKEQDKATKWHKLHPHVLRKFFRTRMATLIPVDVVEALMGHEGYLTEVYRRYSQEDLAKFYKQGEPSLAVYTEMAEISRLRQEIEERNKQLQTLVNGLTAENLELKQRITLVEHYRERIEKLENLMDVLRQSLEEREGEKIF